MGRRLSLLVALQQLGRPVFTTREVASLRGTTVGAASQVLARLARDGALVRATRGVWCIPSDERHSRYALVPYLAGSHPAYVSFLSGLYLHGMIEQIPQVVYVATTAHTRTVRTPVATYSFHQIAPSLFAGFDWYGGGRAFLIAEPEKALVDCLYLSSRKGRRFGSFPELEFPLGFRATRARHWVRTIHDIRIRAHVADKLERVWRDRRESREPTHDSI